MGNSRTIFSQRCWDTSTSSSAKANLSVGMNQSLSFRWKAHSVVLYLCPVYKAALQMARERCHLEAAAGMMEDDMKVGGGVLFVCLKSSPMNGERRWRKKESLSQAIFLEE